MSNDGVTTFDFVWSNHLVTPKNFEFVEESERSVNLWSYCILLSQFLTESNCFDVEVIGFVRRVGRYAFITYSSPDRDNFYKPYRSSEDL